MLPPSQLVWFGQSPCDSKAHENPDWTTEKTHVLCQAWMCDLNHVMIRDHLSWNILLELLERVVFFPLGC